MYLIVVDSTFKMASYSYDKLSELFGVELKDKQNERQKQNGERDERANFN